MLINAGAGYTIAPTITISGGGGTGAAATCSIETILVGVSSFRVTNGGFGYVTSPTVTITGFVGSGQTAVASAVVGTSHTVSQIRVVNPGIGYTIAPTITIAPPSIISGIGTYQFNEIVTGESSGTTGRVKSWDQDTKVLKVSFVNNASSKGFYPGEIVIGAVFFSKICNVNI